MRGHFERGSHDICGLHPHLLVGIPALHAPNRGLFWKNDVNGFREKPAFPCLALPRFEIYEILPFRNGFPNNNLMFQKKSKGLFAEVSAYQIRLARTDRTVNPLQVEAFHAIPVASEDEARRAVENFAGEHKSSFRPAVCAVYPGDRFLHRFSVENAARTRNDDFAEKVLADDLNRTPKDTSFRVLYPTSGKNYDPKESLSRELVFAGAGKTAIREEQSRVLGFGLYPTQLRLASLSLYEGTRRVILEEGSESSTLVLEVGEHGSYVYVVNAGGLALSHSINFGISGITERIRTELGLQDALSSRKVLFSETFDFRDMGATLVGRLTSQIQAFTGQFEVRTGKSITHIILPGLPDNLGWIGEVLASELGMEVWSPEIGHWLEESGIKIPEDSGKNPFSYFPLLCHMANLEPQRS